VTTGSNIAFPELPRSELERAIGELVDKANRVLHTQGRLRQLLSATRSVGEGLELPAALRRIAQAAVDLVGARYGALGVIGPDGELEQFVHVGIDAESAARIGDLPRGRGLLGALVADPRPIRLPHIADDPRSAGFPAHHPPMDSFVGVPITIRDEVFGNLYLADETGSGFSAEDEELLLALAASAAVAIDNARLYEQAKQRQRWSSASAETSAALLSVDTEDPLAVVADTVARLTDAVVVCLLGRTADGATRIEDAWGADAEQFRGYALPAGSGMGATVMDSGNARLSAGVELPGAAGEEARSGPTMTLPIPRPDGSLGALAIVRPVGGARFAESDLEMAMEFASHAGVALQLREARHAAERLALLEDRSRIARDLHDNVIQRLFGAGLALNAVDPHRVPDDVAARIDTVTGLLDEAIAEIRRSVFALRATASDGPSARHRLLDIVDATGAAFPSPPRVLFEGDLDSVATGDLLDDLEAVVREGVANAARHARATTVTVTVAATPTEVRVEVADDGRGVEDATRSSGLANLAERARLRGGSSSLRAGATGGAVLHWGVPRSEAGVIA
jgi:signal transduction histidine kinase